MDEKRIKDVEATMNQEGEVVERLLQWCSWVVVGKLERRIGLKSTNLGECQGWCTAIGGEEGANGGVLASTACWVLPDKNIRPKTAGFVRELNSLWTSYA